MYICIIIIQSLVAKMKKSIKRLPQRAQKQLNILQELILKHIPEVRMIILFGSFARGGYVLYDMTYNGNIREVYQSDFDILVITEANNAGKLEVMASRIINSKYYQLTEYLPHPTPPQIMIENIELMNQVLCEKHYFYTQIVKEGILLYDDGKFVLPKAKKLSHRRIKEISQEYYNRCYHLAKELLDGSYFYSKQEKYVTGSFLLHQACERFYKTLTLVFVHDRPKNHKLEYLETRTKRFSRKLVSVFPKETPEDKSSYEKLCAAYVDARYNSEFTVSKEQFDYMTACTELLCEITRTLCAKQLAFYEKKAQEEENIHQII